MSHEPAESEQVERSRRASQADFFAGLALALIAAYTFVESVRMPFYEEGKRGLLSSPGLTPGLLSAGLMLMSIALMVRARGFRLNLQRLAVSPEMVRVLTVLAILVAYVAGIKLIGYVTSTFVMLAVFQLIFIERRTVATVLGLVIGLSAAVTAALYYVFGKIFLIPIP